MNQGNQQMPFPFIMLPQMGGQHQGPQEEEPARVRVAVEVLNALTFKTMDRAAVNDISIEVLPGQKLSTGESNLQATACNFLTDYLRGQYKPDRIERKRERIVDRHIEAEEQECGTHIQCFACRPGQPLPKCPFCRGTGTVLVFPGGGEPQ